LLATDANASTTRLTIRLKHNGTIVHWRIANRWASRVSLSNCNYQIRSLRLHGQIESAPIARSPALPHSGQFDWPSDWSGVPPRRERIPAWVSEHLKILAAARPELPDTLNDRQQDSVEPLLAIADQAGGDWPVRLRKAVVEIFTGENSEDQSIGVRLADIRAIFESSGAERLSSVDLLSGLVEVETSPWGDWKHGKPLNAVGLAHLLKPFGILPQNHQDGECYTQGIPPRVFFLMPGAGTCLRANRQLRLIPVLTRNTRHNPLFMRIEHTVSRRNHQSQWRGRKSGERQ
jgi:hypothetical protein